MKIREIILDFTSLLDIIMIMLFWVMLNVSNSAQNAEKKAQEKVDAANAKVVQAQKDAQDEIERAKQQNQKELDDMNKKNQEIKQAAEDMQQALDGFGNGKMVTLEMKYEDSHDVIYISQGIEEKKTVSVDEKLKDSLSAALNSYGLDKNSIILTAFVYDGDSVLYRDVEKVQSTLSSIKSNYKNIYYTHINTTK